MELKKIVTKLERLLADLSDLPATGQPARRGRASGDAESDADRWVRKYVRNHRLAIPAKADVIRVLRARTAYAIGFASLLPRPSLELTLERSVQLVEVLMIDMWHGCFRQKWLVQDAEEELAFAT